MEKISILVVMPLVKNEKGEMLAQIRNQPESVEKHNKWELSGGKVEYDETPEQAVVRETKEETGLDVEVVSLYPKVYTKYWTNAEQTKQWKCTLLAYVCNLVGGELTIHPDDKGIKEVRFIAADEIETLEWGAEMDKEILREFSKQ